MHFAMGLLTGNNSLVFAAQPCKHHLKIYPGVRDHAAKVAQFVKKSSLVITFIHNHNAKNIVDPDHLASLKSVYLDLKCLQNMNNHIQQGKD